MSVRVRVLTPLNFFLPLTLIRFFGNNLASSHWFQRQNLEHQRPC